MARNKLFRVDRNLINGEVDEVLLCLPRYFQDILLACTERLEWARTYGTSELTEDEWKRIEAGIYALSQEECQMEITVNPVINISGCGCGGSGSGSGGDCGYPPGTPVPNNPIPFPIPADPDNDIPPAPDVPPVGTELDPARCRLANWTWSMLRLHITTLRGYVLGLQSATTIILGIIAVLPAGLVARIGAGIIAAIANVIVQIRGYLEVAELLFDPILEYWDANQQELVCFFYHGTSQDPISQWVQNELFGYLTDFWDGLGTDSLTRNILWGLWRNAFMRDSLFGLALNGIVPDNWHPSHPVIDCSVCEDETGTYPEPPTSGTSLFLFVEPVEISETLTDPDTNLFAVDSLFDHYEYAASWPTNTTWNPEVESRGEPEEVGDELIGFAIRCANLVTSGGSDPAEGKLRMAFGWVTGGSDNHYATGDIYAAVSSEYAAEFEAWATANNAVLESFNIANAENPTTITHYRRSGITQPAGTLAAVIQLRYIYRREL